jgi:hypothetical protein
MIGSTAARDCLLVVFLGALLFLQACSPDYADQAKQLKAQVTAKFDVLASKLNGGEIANALLIDSYAETVAQSKPNLQAVADLLRKDARTDGALFQNLQTRLAAVSNTPAGEREFLSANEELFSLEAAADPVIYNDSLIDVVNTLADLSDGELPRISIPPNALSAHVKGNPVPGSYLVGNPTYGTWQRNSGGGSFWAFYGQYRLFSDLAFGSRYHRGPIGYNDWHGGGARYSYYGDYGRGTYGSARDRAVHRDQSRNMRAQGIKPSRPAKQYGSAAGNARVSNYSRARSTRTASVAKRQSGLFGGSARSSRAGGK